MPVAPDGTPIPYPGEEQAPPPELLAMLQGAQGAPPAVAAEAEMGSADDRFREAIELLQSVVIEESDDADSQALAGVIAKLYALLAARQKESDAMMGGNPGQLRQMRRLNAA